MRTRVCVGSQWWLIKRGTAYRLNPEVAYMTMAGLSPAAGVIRLAQRRELEREGLTTWIPAGDNGRVGVQDVETRKRRREEIRTSARAYYHLHAARLRINRARNRDAARSANTTPTAVGNVAA